MVQSRFTSDPSSLLLVVTVVDPTDTVELLTSDCWCHRLLTARCENKKTGATPLVLSLNNKHPKVLWCGKVVLSFLGLTVSLHNKQTFRNVWNKVCFVDLDITFLPVRDSCSLWVVRCNNHENLLDYSTRFSNMWILTVDTQRNLQIQKSQKFFTPTDHLLVTHVDLDSTVLF
jgi:hypothetical protein